jgi:hypothetical protein
MQGGEEVEGVGVVQGRVVITAAEALRRRRRSLPQIHTVIVHRDKVSITTEQLNYRKALVRFCLSKLKKYQSSWIQERRD